MVKLLAEVILATPRLRAAFLANPTAYVGQALPPRKYWDDELSWKLSDWFAARDVSRRDRARLAKKVLLAIARDLDKHRATLNTDAVFEDSFAPIVQVSQRSLTTTFRLSWGAFWAGVVLIIAGVGIAVFSPGDVNSGLVAGIFGGAGAGSTLGAVYALAKQGIREATIDHATFRLVLTTLAIQLGQLRGLVDAARSEDGATPRDNAILQTRLTQIDDINTRIEALLARALTAVPTTLTPQTEETPATSIVAT